MGRITALGMRCCRAWAGSAPLGQRKLLGLYSTIGKTTFPGKWCCCARWRRCASGGRPPLRRVYPLMTKWYSLVPK
eukprot:16084432-Heterocapsa_arctica.AAC.1